MHFIHFGAVVRAVLRPSSRSWLVDRRCRFRRACAVARSESQVHTWLPHASKYGRPAVIIHSFKKDLKLSRL